MERSQLIVASTHNASPNNIESDASACPTFLVRSHELDYLSVQYNTAAH